MTTQHLDNEEESGFTSNQDPVEIGAVVEQLRAEQRFGLALLAGLLASAACAGIWAAVTALTEYQIGWMAVGVGFVVALAVRMAGRGIDRRFGVAGAALALLGCVAGNLLAISYFVAVEQAVPYTMVLGALRPAIAIELLSAGFHPMDLLFYGIALYEGYRFSFRTMDEEELQQVMVEPGAVVRA